jgi:hypothetical protein
VQRFMKLGGFFALDVQKELIFPRTSVNWAAFDFQEIDAMIGEGPQCCK